MKIPASASYEVIYSIGIHPFLGPLIEAYVVQLTSAGNLSFVSQRLHGTNADYYDKKLDINDYEAIELIDEFSPEFIVKKFSKVKKIRPKEFFAKHFTKDIFKKEIRPHIEKRLSKVMRLIYGKKVYIKELKNVTYAEVEWTKHTATVLFHLRRNEDNTHYFATVKHNNQRVHFSKSSAILLTEEPCYLITGNRILQFEDDFEGQKIIPFLRKNFIEIPKSTEETYLSKIIVPLLEKYPMYAVGYEIVTEKYIAKPILKISKLWNGGYGLILAFRYGEQTFLYDGGKSVSVNMEKWKDTYKFTRIKRSLGWEEIKKETLLTLDVNHLQGSQFGWTESSDIVQVISWVTANQNQLGKAGFELIQDLDDVYQLDSGLLTYEWTEENDWFDVKAVVKFGSHTIPFQIVRKAILSGKQSIQLPDGSLAIIPERWIEQIQGFAEYSISEDGIRLKKHHIGLLANALNDQTTSEDRLKSLAQFTGVKSKELPKGFTGQLRNYQKAGYDWLFFLREFNFGGCLADDMGLGKTVQTLAMLQRIKEENQESAIPGAGEKAGGQVDLFRENATANTSLLVVPTSLIHNWLYEAKKFCPDLIFGVHAGMTRSKSSDKFRYYDVVITTYGTLRNDLKLFQAFHFDTIILDESQFIKNPLSKLASAVYKLKGQTKLALTGTPVENTIVDLWSQMNFANPGLLGDYNFFQKEYVNPIEKHFDADKTNRLHSVIKPFVMRRTKLQVATDLPPKTEQIVYCDMTADQEDMYEKTKSTYRNMILDTIEKTSVSRSKIQILSGLMKLRQMANHPSLSDSTYTGESGKFQQVEQMLLTALEEGHKVLLFSQFVGHLQLYRNLLDTLKIPYAYLDGSTPSKKRQSEVKKFQANEVELFLISLKAGGFGLNLTAADYVFMLDPWWNPAAENQAIDRTHRIGQTRNVFSYRFVTNNTVEEKIVKLQNRKKELSNSLIKTESSYLKNIEVEELKELFT